MVIWSVNWVSPFRMVLKLFAKTMKTEFFTIATCSFGSSNKTFKLRFCGKYTQKSIAKMIRNGCEATEMIPQPYWLVVEVDHLSNFYGSAADFLKTLKN